jgi:ureidoglycolate lyase
MLERHPFTTQMFIPLSITREGADARYLIVVAPEKKTALSWSESVASLAGDNPPDKSLQSAPDIGGIVAFIADQSQAVTYGSGVWHAPMIVLGEVPLDFVVVQYANGHELEDCQEFALDGVDKRRVTDVEDCQTRASRPPQTRCRYKAVYGPSSSYTAK